MAYIVMAYIVMAIVQGTQSCTAGIYSFGLYSYGLYNYGYIVMASSKAPSLARQADDAAHTASQLAVLQTEVYIVMALYSYGPIQLWPVYSYGRACVRSTSMTVTTTSMSGSTASGWPTKNARTWVPPCYGP